MSNVKPGDLARIIFDTLELNVGKQVHVEQVHIPRSLGEALMCLSAGSTVWVCTALQPLRATASATSQKIVWVMPGQMICCADSWLKRIDPPADSMELLAEFPLPGEHRSMEDLHEYVSNKELKK
jgi:hypothetical protein